MGIIQTVRIYITGPCVTGKTTFAKFLSKELGVKTYSLDELFIDFKKTGNGKVVYFDDKTCKERLAKVTNTKSWIIEGEFHIKELASMSDYTVYATKSVVYRLYLATRRYILNAEVRKKFGFASTVVFLKFIARQSLDTKKTTKYFGKDFLSVVGFEEFVSRIPRQKLLLLKDFQYKTLLASMIK